MSDPRFDHLLETVRATHSSDERLSAFAPFPDDIVEQQVEPFHIPAADLLNAETGWASTSYDPLCDAFIAVGSAAKWRETYKGTKIDQDFMDRFACYNLIGEGGPFMSSQMWAWVIYQPPHLFYPWHHHPGEEMYLVIAGEGEFMAQGRDPVTLGPGNVATHVANQPHALHSHDSPIMAYVIWRNGFETPPVWTDEEMR